LRPLVRPSSRGICGTIPSMPMTPFVERFPGLGVRETRSLIVTGRPPLPNGEYGFLEFYCNEPRCDCRRVMVLVVRPETGWKKIWATLNYGWESEEFYQRWAKAPPEDQFHWQGPFLDPLGAQTSYAGALLDLFKLMVQAPDYVERLQRHYQLFRSAVEDECGQPNPAQRFPPSRRGHRSRRRHGPR
jgi:hypothetical protein